MKNSGWQKGFIFLLGCAAIAVAVYFGYINRNTSSSEEVLAIGEVQDILMLDLDNNYPPTAREVVNCFCRIYKALYGENASDEQISQMGKMLLKLYDTELINNQVDYDLSVMQEVNRKKKDGYTISTYRVQSAAETITKKIDDNELTYVACAITMRKGSQLNANDYIFVLRKEESSGRWKIFGWTVTGEDG
ncbi:MAG: hypothetical protein K6B72_09445 [Lachnospiraceae bacterium]|nr:hypothetical protein [Lachnospiraceae bacterium]